MGVPFTIQPEDDRRLKALKEDLGAGSKVEVLRKALNSLEEELRRQKRSRRLTRAARLVAQESAKVNLEFRSHSLLKKT